MNDRVDRHSLQLFPSISGDSDEDTSKLIEMGISAISYISNQSWGMPPARLFLACGVGAIFSVWLLEFDENIKGTDDSLWVVIGDIPSAYFVTDELYDCKSVSKYYVFVMKQWAQAIIMEKPLFELYPVDAEPTKTNAYSLLERLRFIEENII